MEEPPYIPPHRYVRLNAMIAALSATPPRIRVVVGAHSRRVSFNRVVKWIKRHDRVLYRYVMRAFGCETDSCLSRGMSLLYHWVISQLDSMNISYDDRVEWVGGLLEALLELGRIYNVEPLVEPLRG